MSAKDIETLTERIYRLIEMVEIADENGLFKNSGNTRKEINNLLLTALSKLKQDNPKFTEAIDNYSEALARFNNGVNNSSFCFKFLYVMGWPVVIYLVGLFLGIIALWFTNYCNVTSASLVNVPAWAYLWGSLGSIVNCMWWFWQHVSSRKIRKGWYVWYLLSPFIGALLGALTYLAFYGGFVTITGGGEIKQSASLMFLSALAGFYSRRIVNFLYSIAEKKIT